MCSRWPHKYRSRPIMYFIYLAIWNSASELITLNNQTLRCQCYKQKHASYKHSGYFIIRVKLMLRGTLVSYCSRTRWGNLEKEVPKQTPSYGSDLRDFPLSRTHLPSVPNRLTASNYCDTIYLLGSDLCTKRQCWHLTCVPCMYLLLLYLLVSCYCTFFVVVF